MTQQSNTPDPAVPYEHLQPPYGPFDGEEHTPPLEFEQWAKLSAKLNGAGEEEQEQTLAGAKLPAGLWQAVDRFWQLTMADQIRMGEYGLARRFGALCAAAYEKRTAEGRVASLVTMQAPAQQPQPAPDASADMPAATPAAGDGSDAPAPAPGGSDDLDGTALMVALPDEPTLPFGVDAAAPRSEVAATDPSQQLPSLGAVDVGMTASIDRSLVERAIAGYSLPVHAPLSPERYAELCAASVGQTPDERAAVHKRFDIVDEAHRTRVDQEMTRYLKVYAEANAAYQKRLQSLFRDPPS